MKEIGEKLREARENMGISINEVSDDLKVTVTQIESIENGNMEMFKDIFYLKYFIRDYAKYLGLNKEDLVDEFNEYLFDYTSKLSLDEIRKARHDEKKDKLEKKIKSPYTIERKRGLYIPPIVIYVLIGLLILILLYFIITSI
ncbi:MAG: helix-turn-helix domain-containing protein [Bacilli bacterium]|nr:helix-turn-helix domain-containing protein [Bacilli bacterium]